MEEFTLASEFASMDEIDLSKLRKLQYEFDLLIVGSGPAGQKAAFSAAKAGARVALVEMSPLAGGVCLNTGTIPSKALREAVVYLTGYRQRGYYGEDYRLKDKVKAGDLVQRTDHVVRMERAVINEALLRNGITRLVGKARVTGPQEVSVSLGSEQTRYTAASILVAVGTRPRRPANVPFDGINVFDSDDVFVHGGELRPLPENIIVLGAGVIGIEYATMFAALDIPVVLIDPRPNPLDFVDREIVQLLYRALEKRGVTIRFNTEHEAIELLGEPGDWHSHVRLTLKNGDVLESDALLFALGREPMTEDIGLREVGVELTKRGQVVVDESYRTSVPSIYAAGDVIGFPSLASTSAEQGRVAALNAIDQRAGYDHSTLPFGIYTIPEVSMVGRTEQELKEKGTPYFCGTALWRETARGKIIGDLDGAMKLIFDGESRKLVGVHVIGEGATELLHIGQAVMHFGGGPEYFCDTVFNYPTLAEAYKIAGFNAVNRLLGTTTRVGTLLEQTEDAGPPPEWLEWTR